MLRYFKLEYPFNGLNSIPIIIKFICIISLISFTSAKTYKPFESTHGHRCLDWRFGDWKPMLYSMQPSVSPPIYHQHKQPTSEIYHIQNFKPQSSSANYIQLPAQSQSWLPFYQNYQQPGQAKVVRYNVRKQPASKYLNYPQYPQYLPTTVLHLNPTKKQRKQSYGYRHQSNNHNKKLNIYPVPIQSLSIKPYPLKNIYSSNQQPNLIYEQLDYQLSNHHFKKFTNGYSIQTTIPSNEKLYNQYPSRPSGHATHVRLPIPPVPIPQINRPKTKKTTIAAYIPVVQVPAIEQPAPQNYPKVNLNQSPKKPLGHAYEEKIIEEHIYQLPNQVLNELNQKSIKNPYPLPPIDTTYQQHPIIQHLQMPAKPKQSYMQNLPMISQPVSHVHQSYGPQSHSYNVEIGKPQISYEIEPHYNINQNYDNKQLDGPPIYDSLAYHQDNYAKPEDSGLFKPLLDQTRKENNYPKIGVVPYRHNDPVKFFKNFLKIIKYF